MGGVSFHPGCYRALVEVELQPKGYAAFLIYTLFDRTSLRTLLDELSTIVRNTCRTPGTEAHAPTFEIVTIPNANQTRALELLATIAT